MAFERGAVMRQSSLLRMADAILDACDSDARTRTPTRPLLHCDQTETSGKSRNRGATMKSKSKLPLKLPSLDLAAAEGLFELTVKAAGIRCARCVRRRNPDVPAFKSSCPRCNPMTTFR